MSDRWNLLTAPLLRVRTHAGEDRASLCRVLEMLGRDEVEGFPGLQRHQRDAWHVFLVQIATMALARAGKDDPVQPASFWEKALLALSEGEPSAWRLVEPDRNKPAFLQPPWPRDRLLEPDVEAPDLLDMLQLAKNHDLKRERVREGDADLWLFALVSLQTRAGFDGRGNQGIARMNSGYGQRIVVELVHSERWGARFMDAVKRLLAHRRRLLQPEENCWNYAEQGKALLWLDPWDGKKSDALAGLDPCFVEICRIVRLVEQENGRLAAARAPADKPRLAAKDLHGVVGDPWTPVCVDADPSKALTLNANGFTAEWQRRLVFEDGVALSSLQRPCRDDGDMWLIGSVIVRGQGRTDGLHVLRIPIPRKARGFLFGQIGAQRERLNARAKDAIAAAGDVEGRALRAGLHAWLEAGEYSAGQPGDLQQGAWRKGQERFRRAWEAELFPWLWREAEKDDDEALRAWQAILRKAAERAWRETLVELPAPAGRRWKARVAAEGVFHAGLRSTLGLLFS